MATSSGNWLLFAKGVTLLGWVGYSLVHATHFQFSYGIIVMWFCGVVLDLFSSLLTQVISCKGRLLSELFYVEWATKLYFSQCAVIYNNL